LSGAAMPRGDFKAVRGMSGGHFHDLQQQTPCPESLHFLRRDNPRSVHEHRKEWA
jgi:hypothetical protein